MAIASVATFLSAQNKTAESTTTFTTSSAIAAGNVGVISLGFDNISTGGGATTDVTSVTVGGVTCTKLGEFSNAGSAGEACTVWVGLVRAVSEIASGADVVITFGSSVTAKSITGWEFSVGSGKTLTLDSSVTLQADATWNYNFNALADTLYAALTYPAIEHLWVLAEAYEETSTFWDTSGCSPVPTVSFTATPTTGGSADTNIIAHANAWVSAGSTEPIPYSGVNAEADRASWYGALYETDAPSVDLSKTATDHVNVSDTLTNDFPLSKALTDQENTSDTLLPSMANFVKNVTDQAKVAESLAGLLTVGRALSDQANATDSATGSIPLPGKSVADSAVASDVLVQSLTGGPLAKSLSDPAQISDSLALAAVPSTSALDTARISDPFAVLLTIGRALSDNISASDAISKSLNLAKSLSDSILASASSAQWLNMFVKSVSDTALVTDSLQSLVSVSVALADSATVSDSLSTDLRSSVTSPAIRFQARRGSDFAWGGRKNGFRLD